MHRNGVQVPEERCLIQPLVLQRGGDAQCGLQICQRLHDVRHAAVVGDSVQPLRCHSVLAIESKNEGK